MAMSTGTAPASLAPPQLTQAAPEPNPASSSATGTGTDVAHTILRIKRKRGQDPVEALVIQQAERRAKRRSNVHDAGPSRSTSAAVDPSSRDDGQSDAEDEDLAERAGPSRGVFRLAETVSLESFSDPAAARLLHERITALSRTGKREREGKPHPIAPLPSSRSIGGEASRSQRSSASPAPPSGTVSDPLGRSVASLRGSRDGTASPSPLGPAERGVTPSDDTVTGKEMAPKGREDDKATRQKSSMAASLRFKVVRKEPLGQLRHAGSTGSLRRKLKGGANRSWQDSRRPPQIRSKKEKDAEAVFGRIIDAVSQKDEGRGKGSRAKGKGAADQPPRGGDADMNALDSRFAELLGNYLKDSNLEPSADLAGLSSGQKRTHEPDSDSESSSFNSDNEDEDDYVYDIYYRDVLPSRTGPAGAAESGLEPAAVPGHERLLATRSSVPDSMAVPRVQGGAVVPPELPPAGAASAHFSGLDFVSGGEVVAMAQLEGFEDTDDELEAADDGEGYESYDEGEDEDSNDEDFYRNDYPEEELPDDEDMDFGAYNDDSDDGGEEEDPYALSDGSF